MLIKMKYVYVNKKLHRDLKINKGRGSKNHNYYNPGSGGTGGSGKVKSSNDDDTLRDGS